MKRLILGMLIFFNFSLLAQTDTLSFLFDNFEDTNDTTAMWNGPWEVFSDETAGSGFVAEYSNLETHDNSIGAMHVSGQFASFGGVAAYFQSDKTSPRNLKYDGITFWVVASLPSPEPVRFRIREKKAEDLRGWNYFGYVFTPGSEWQKVTIPFDSLKIKLE